jgi:hypothetical protein
MAATSGNANGNGKTLKRIEFEFKGKSYKFALNPEAYTQSEGGRVTVTQTKGGANVEFFGSALAEISFSGTTGFKNRTTNRDSGYEKFKELRDLVKSVYDNITDGKEVTDEDLLKFYNFTDNEYFYTVPDKFNMSRSKSNPLMYKYEIHLFCIRKLGQAATPNTIQKIGNPLGVQATYNKTLNQSTPANTTNTAADAKGVSYDSTSSYYSSRYVDMIK